MRGGKREGAGAPKGPHNREKRKKDTITLYKRDWVALDKIGPSRGKAVEMLLADYLKKNGGSGRTNLDRLFHTTPE